TNSWIDITPDFHQRRFPVTAASLPVIPAAGGIPAHHFVQESNIPADTADDGTVIEPAYTNRDWVAIVVSTGDLPPLRYGSLFMDSCSSGRHFGATLTCKAFFYTREESSSLIDEISYKDLKPQPASPYVSYIYLERIILGHTLASTADFLNSVRRKKGETLNDHFSVSQ
ncbi:MAG: hypothetical protein K9M97_12320, partial [Akkermansiaceae bacterium]|nr:hypothetical protein [Akkermansiaceae bacterium]